MVLFYPGAKFAAPSCGKGRRERHLVISELVFVSSAVSLLGFVLLFSIGRCAYCMSQMLLAARLSSRAKLD